MADETPITPPATKPDPADPRAAQFSRIAAWTDQRKAEPEEEEPEREEETDAA